MSRKRKGPWLRKQDNCYYTTVGRTLVKLGPASDPWDRIEAEFHRVQLDAKKNRKGKGKSKALTVRRLCDDFLEFVQVNNKPATYKWYAEFLVPFAKQVKPTLKVDRLTPAALTRWINKAYGNHSDTTRHSAARAVVRVMNWAVKERIIDASPLAGFVKPRAGRREVAITPAQYESCMEHVKGPFGDVVTFLWESGARPQEFPVIEAAWVDDRKIVFPVAKSKGGQRTGRRRVIYLNEKAAGIVHRLCAEHATGPIFRNSKGRPWKKDAVNCAFKRLRKLTGIKGLCAYAIRHGFATAALKRGVDTTTVGILMGHANPNMVANIYQHLAEDDNYMLSVINGESHHPADIHQAVAG